MAEEPLQPAEPNQDSSNATDSLESDAQAFKAPAGGSQVQTGGDTGKLDPKQWLARANIYGLLVVLILIAGAGITVLAYRQSSGRSSPNLTSQDLKAATLKTLADSDVSVGSPDQILKVEANALFGGNVLVRQNLDIAGALHLGSGTLAVSGFTASDKTQLADTQVNKNLSVAGSTALQGAVTVAKGLQVGGSGSFGGPVSAPQISTANLQISGDLVLSSHITLGGPGTSRTYGTALGSGGSASVSGSDSGGVITINTGSSPPAGCFVTIGFVRKFNNVPRVLVTPVGSAAGSLDYYITGNSSGFSLCTASAPAGGATFAFDYFVFD
jgi:hypothetical protein